MHDGFTEFFSSDYHWQPVGADDCHDVFLLRLTTTANDGDWLGSRAPITPQTGAAAASAFVPGGGLAVSGYPGVGENEIDYERNTIKNQRFIVEAEYYEASVDYYAPLDITFVFLSNLYSLTNYQLRRAVRNLIAGRPTVAMIRPPAVSPATQDPAPFLGDYGDADDPVPVSQENGRLFRDGNEFYPIADGWFYVPGTGARFRFTRGADSTVNGMFTRWESGEERQWARVGPPK